MSGGAPQLGDEGVGMSIFNVLFTAKYLQEKSSIRELMVEEHQMEKRDQQCRLKLTEAEQIERLKAVVLFCSVLRFWSGLNNCCC